MPLIDRVCRIGSMSESLRLYVPVMALQRGLGLVRVVLLAYLLSEAQLGLWGLGSMIFSLAAPVLALGANQGLMRYVSHYEARDQLRAFYRRVRGSLVILVLVLGAAAMIGAPLLARVMEWSRAAARGAEADLQLHVVYAALANGVLLALYHNALGVMYGMRAYRMVSTVEVAFSVAFTVAVVAVLLPAASAAAALWTHLACLAGALVLAAALLEAAMRRVGPSEAPEDDEAVVLASAAEDDELPAGVEPQGVVEPTVRPTDRLLRRVLRFGSVALLGNVFWMAAHYVSFYLTLSYAGEAAAGVFYAFLRLGQPILFLANAAWSVIFTHVARHWESPDRPGALFRLDTAYKAVCVGLMTLAVAMYASAPLWVLILPVRYHGGAALIGGLLLFFQVNVQLAIVLMLAQLHERPLVIALTALAGGTGNWLLARWWIASGTPAPLAAAQAAGVGMYVGAGVVAAGYLLLTRTRVSIGAWVVLASPGLLLLARPWAVAAWGVVLVGAVATRVVFSGRQKALLRGYAARGLARLRGGGEGS